MSEYDFNINDPPCQEYQPKLEESCYGESEPCELTIIIYRTAGCTNVKTVKNSKAFLAF